MKKTPAAEVRDHALRRVVDIARRAPSVYNTQPWTWSIHGDALELYAAAHAAWDETRVRGRLRELGVRRRLVSPKRPDAGWEALTDSELAVVRLVAEGMTNREVASQLYVSPHTVSTHLRHAFSKLGINSRVDLTRIAVEQAAVAARA